MTARRAVVRSDGVGCDHHVDSRRVPRRQARRRKGAPEVRHSCPDQARRGGRCPDRRRAARIGSALTATRRIRGPVPIATADRGPHGEHQSFSADLVDLLRAEHLRSPPELDNPRPPWVLRPPQPQPDSCFTNERSPGAGSGCCRLRPRRSEPPDFTFGGQPPPHGGWW